MSVELVATMTDKYGEPAIIHKTRHGWRKKQEPTEIILANRMIAPLIGAKIKALRLAAGLTMKQAGIEAGLFQGDPKQRWYAIEVATRGQGVRLGTLHRIATLFGIETRDLIPTNKEIDQAMRKARGGM